MLQREIEQKLTREIKRLGGLAYKFVSPGNSGVPDRLVILPGGRVIFAELKTDKGVLSGQQKRQIARLQKLGCDVRVIYGPEGLREFLQDVIDDDF